MTNIFVEGIQGMGKSTLINGISKLLPKLHVCREGDYSPVDLAWCAWMSEVDYKAILLKYPELESEILVLCQDLVQVKMSFSHSNLPAIPKLPVDTILQNHRVTYNRNDYEFVWYYKTFPSIQIPGGMHVCNC